MNWVFCLGMLKTSIEHLFFLIFSNPKKTSLAPVELAMQTKPLAPTHARMHAHRHACTHARAHTHKEWKNERTKEITQETRVKWVENRDRRWWRDSGLFPQTHFVPSSVSANNQSCLSFMSWLKYWKDISSTVTNSHYYSHNTHNFYLVFTTVYKYKKAFRFYKNMNLFLSCHWKVYNNK